MVEPGRETDRPKSHQHNQGSCHGDKDPIANRTQGLDPVQRNERESVHEPVNKELVDNHRPQEIALKNESLA